MHSALRSGGGGLARIFSPPQCLREYWLLREGVKRWMLCIEEDEVV
jgi:hypothetical protein